MISGRKWIALSIISALSFSNASASELESLDFNVEKKKEEVVDYSDMNFDIIDLNTKENEELIKEDEKITKLRKIISDIDPKFGNAEIKELKEIDGFYQVSNEKTTLYITEDGKHIIPVISKVIGNKFEDIQKEKDESKIAADLKEISPENMVKYSAAKNVPLRTKLYVFSDFTCPYCKRMHNELLTITNMGVEVNYIPYPRNGTVDQPALLGLQRIMCSTTPTLEFDSAFLDPKKYVQGINAINAACIGGKRALHNSLTLGDKFKVNGTPYIFTEDGAFIGGWHGINTFTQKLTSELKRAKARK